MISEKYKCIFVHIPKTAGQSIEHFFLSLHGLSWNERSPLLLKFNPDRCKGPERLAHLFAREYVEFNHIEQDLFEDYFKFTFVRNPWARLVSEYNFRGDSRRISFRDFVLQGLTEGDPYSDKYRHTAPQCEFIYDQAGNQLVDYVGRFESLQRDFSHICSKLKIVESQLPHVNSSKNKKTPSKIAEPFRRGKEYTEYYDEETREAVARLYEKDISAFGYTFGD